MREGGSVFTRYDAEIGCRRGGRSAQEELRKGLLERVRAFAIVRVMLAVPGSCRVSRLLVAWVCKPGSASQLVSTWTESWRVVWDGSSHVYNVQDIVTGETKEVHVLRMRVYVDSSFAVGAEVQGLFERTKHQGEYEIQEILNSGEDLLKAGDFKVQVAWVNLDNEKPTWEPVEVMFKDTPNFRGRKLEQMRLPKQVKNALRQRYGMKI